MATTRVRRRFLPYRYSRFGISFTVRECTLDGARVTRGFDETRQLVELDNEHWSHALVHADLSITGEVLEAVLPEVERSQPPLELLVAVHCPDTRLRRGHIVAGPPLPSGNYSVDIPVARDDLFGALFLTPFLVRGSDAYEPLSGYAHRRGARVAGARFWEIRVDRRRFSEGQYLNIRRTRFSEDELLRPFADTLYRLDCNQTDPILWLNIDHEEIDQLLSTRASVGRRAQMREVCFDAIAHSVWTQLFLKTLDDLGKTTDEEHEVAFDWQRGVLAEILPRIYPDEPDAESRRSRLVRAARDDLSLVLQDLDSALQRHNQLIMHVNRLIEVSLR